MIIGKKFAFAAFVCIVFFAFAPFVFAIDYGGIGAYPANPDPNDERTKSWFIYNLPGGAQKQDALIVQNSSDQELGAIIYAQDSVRSSDGGFALKQFGDEKAVLGSWVRLFDPPPKSLATTTLDILSVCESASFDLTGKENAELVEWCNGKDYLEIILPPNSSQEIPFVISIPENADVGEHTGGIAIQKKLPDKVDQQSGVALTTRVGVRIYETVPGEIVRGLSVASFTVTQLADQGLIRSSLAIRNAGNTSVDADVVLGISDSWFGSINQSMERSVQVLRGDEAVVNFEIPRPLFGRLTLEPQILYRDAANQEMQVQVAATTIWVVPWLQLGLAAAGLLLFSGGIWTAVRISRRAYDTTGWFDYTVGAGDTITSLAREAGVSWKTLAKANQIRSPYVIEIGQRLKLPIRPSRPNQKRREHKIY